MRFLPLVLVPLLVFSCSSEDEGSSTSSVSPSAGGASGGGTGGADSGGSSSGGSSPGGSSPGGSNSGGNSGTAGSATGGAGQGGSSAGGAAGGAGQGGSGVSGSSGQAGAGGGLDCCATIECGGANPVCVEGECFDLKPGECFSDADCGGKPCSGASVCPCGALCGVATTPGQCEEGPPQDWAKCGVPGDCTIAANTCCGVCGMPELKDVDAVNKAAGQAHFQAVCPEPGPCPACATMQNPDLMAACALGQGKCIALEISKSSFASCSKDEDCLLRTPQCCACGALAKEQLVAINQGLNAAFMSELGCDQVDCAPCVDPPDPPAGVKAVCDPQTKLCRVSP